MSRVIATIILSWVAFAQNAPDPELERAAKSPYDLARYIDSHTGFDWEPLWKSLGVADASLLPCERSGDCSTELITVLEPRQTILVIDTPWNTEVYIRYLGNESGGWRRAGAYEALIKNYPRRHEMTHLGGKPFLRVASQGVSGSDVSSEEEVWIDLTQPDLQPVFAFSPQGHQSRLGFGISRTIHASASPRVIGQVETIDVYLEVRYSGFDVDLGLGEYSAAYERRPQQKDFTLRDVKSGLVRSSTIPNKEFEDLIDLDQGPTNEQLLVYALPGLKEVASGKNADAKESLGFMLSKCKDTPEKRALLELLAKP